MLRVAHAHADVAQGVLAHAQAHPQRKLTYAANSLSTESFLLEGRFRVNLACKTNIIDS